MAVGVGVEVDVAMVRWGSVLALADDAHAVVEVGAGMRVKSVRQDWHVRAASGRRDVERDIAVQRSAVPYIYSPPIALQLV